MRLVISRSQAKGMMGMGSVNFEIKGRVELAQEEADLVKHYKLRDTILFARQATVFGRLTEQVITVSVRNLLDGDSFKCKDVTEVIAYGEGLVDACKNLKAYLEIARHFGGEETIEI